MATAAELILSGLFAGLVAVAVTRAIEKLGGTAGGILATLPTTVVPASLGMFYELGSEDVQAAMFAIPMGMLIDGAFLMCWKFLLPRVPTHWPRTKQVLFAVAVTLAAWLVMASCVAAFSVRVLNSPSSVGGAGVAATLLSALVGGIACFSPPEAPTGTNSVSTCMLLARSVCAACSIGIAVAIAAVSEVAGGIASTFPAIFFTTMVGLWISQGDGVPLGAIGPMVLGSTAVSLYALLFGGLVAQLGPWATAVLSWFLAACFASIPSYFFVRWRARSARRLRQDSTPDLDDFDLVLKDFDGVATTPGPPIAATSPPQEGV